jgi:hypothetical protein
MAKDVPQGLKPSMAGAFYGTAEAVHFVVIFVVSNSAV